MNQIEVISIDTVGIGVKSISQIDIQKIPDWSSPASGIFVSPPVVIDVGVPIVDIPGCVEAHEQNTNRERSGIISEDDPKGVKTYCDAGVPSYAPIQYEPDQLVITRPAEVPKVPSPETPPVPETPEVPSTPAATAKIECPTKVQQAQEPVGTMLEGLRKKVVRYELIDNTCVQITEAVPLPQQIVAGLPSGGQVVQVGGVAVIATTSALLAKPLADILLKVVKPTIKKVMKKIAAIRGKKVKPLSVSERRVEQRDRNHAIMELRRVVKK